MAMELEFWIADGTGERLDFAMHTAAWQILPFTKRYTRPEHVYIILKHTSRQRGEWIIWIKHGYTSATQPTIGEITNVPT